MRLTREESELLRVAKMAMEPGLLAAKAIYERVISDAVAEATRKIEEVLSAPRKARKLTTGRNGWSDDPEERSNEMMRRRAVARGEVPSRQSWKRHVKDPALSRQRKAAWDALSPQKKRERLAKLEAGKQKAMRQRKKEQRAANSQPVITMEKTA